MLNLNWINQKNLPHLNMRVHFFMTMMRLAYSMMKTTTSGKKKIQTMMKLLL
jgi:hypothetical protein